MENLRYWKFKEEISSVEELVLEGSVDHSQDRLPNDRISVHVNREERLRTEVTENSETPDLYSVCKHINYKIPHTTPVMKLTQDNVIKQIINAIISSPNRTNITIKT
jgi:hypothetical protein